MKNLKQQNKNITEFSKYYFMKNLSHKEFIRHYYLAYAWLRHYTLVKTENPERSKTPINVILFTSLVRYIQFGLEDILEKEVLQNKQMMEKAGFQVVGIAPNGTLRKAHNHDLVESTQLTRLARLILSQKEITPYVNNWKTIKSFKVGTYSWTALWFLANTILELNHTLKSIVYFSKITKENDKIVLNFSFGDKVFEIEQSILSKGENTMEMSLLKDGEKKTIIQKKNVYDARRDMRSHPILTKIATHDEILKRKLKNSLPEDNKILSKDEILSKMIPRLDKMGYFTEFSFSDGKVSCQIVDKKIRPGQRAIYKTDGHFSMEGAFNRALEIFVEELLLWENI